MIVETTAQAETVIAGERGIAETAAPGSIVACMSTIDPFVARRLAERLAAKGVAMLDAPVSGGTERAASGELSIIAGGPRDAYDACRDVFLAMGTRLFHVGGSGQGLAMKLVNNMLVQVNTVAVAEALVMGVKAGLDPHKTVEIISSGAGTSRMFEVRGPMMAANTYLPATMRSSTWKKDLTVIGEFASSLDCPTPLFSVASALYAATLAMGRGDEDSGAVCAMLEMMAGIERKS